jgi:hypothetical protein
MTKELSGIGGAWLFALGALSNLTACAADAGSSPNGDAPSKKEVAVQAGPDGYLEDYGLSCETSVSEGSLRVSLKNNSGSEVRLFGWGTPWDTYGDVLHVRDSQTREDVAYKGPKLNRLRDETSDLVVPPRDQITANYPVSTWYPTTQAQHYDVFLKAKTFEISIDGRAMHVAHRCGTVMLEVPADRPGEITQSLLQPYPSCSAEQQAQIQPIIDESVRAATLALEDFDNGNSYPRTRWFGSQAISPRSAYERMLSEDEYVRCGSDGKPCEGNLGVVVDYFFDEKLYLCAPVFGTTFASLEEHNQQVGTLVHELAHLVDQSTDSIVDFQNPSCNWIDPENPEDTPYCYGFADSIDLATHCLDCARRNAENYQYFAMQAYMRAPLFTTLF